MSSDTTSPRRARDEDGIVLVFVLLAVLVIGAVSVLMFRSARFEQSATGRAAAHEASLHAADAGAEAVFGQINRDNAWSTGHTYPDELGTSPAQQREWALSQTVDDGARIALPNGYGYGIGPVTIDGADVVFGIGVIGDPERPQSRRVVRTEIITGTGGLDGAGVLAGTDIHMVGGGQTTVIGNLHANCNVILDHNTTVEGDATASCDYSPNHQTINVTGTSGGSWPTQSIPEVRAIELYHDHVGDEDLDWYDLCRASNGSGEIRAGSVDGPCTGPLISTVSGNQRWNGWSYHDAVRSWRSNNGQHPSGVFYAHELNLDLQNTSNQRRATFIASASDDTSGSDYGGRSGNIATQDRAFHYLTPWALFADRDINGLDGGNKRFDGLVYAGEQLAMDGGFQMTGSIIIADAESTPGSPIHENTFSGGGSNTIEFVSAYDIFGNAVVQVFAWSELFE